MSLQYAAKENRRRQRAAAILSAGSVEVWGESLFYEASGSAELGPAILFLHEAGGAGSTWHGQLTEMAQGARSLVPDLPGHGRSAGTGYRTVADYREGVLAFLDTLAIRWPVAVAGLCLGAAVAIDMALHAPERVSGLVLSGISDGGAASLEVQRAVAERLRGERLKRWKLTSPLVRQGDLRAVADYPVTRRLNQVSHPVLLVTGEADRITPKELAFRLAGQLADGRAAVLPRASLLVMAEQPAAYNQALINFLAELPGSHPMQGEEHRGAYRRY